MKESSVLTRPRWCKHCGARVGLVVNPYYGVGLAVHRYLTSCKRCGFVEFMPNTGRSDENRPAESAGVPQGGDHEGTSARFSGSADLRARARTVARWGRTHRISLTFFVVLGGVFIGMLAVALLR